MPEKEHKNSIVYSKAMAVLLIIGIIVSLVMLVNLLRERSNFNNSLLNGDYNGSLLTDDGPVYVLNATFDGMGSVSGFLNVDGEWQPFEDYYIVGGNEFKMDIPINDTLRFQLIGNLIDQEKQIIGEFQVNDSGNIANGTYQLLEK